MGHSLMRTIARVGLGIDIALLFASLVVCFSGTSIRYIWPTSAGQAAGMWIGSGGLGYISYVSVPSPNTKPRWFDEQIGWSLGCALESVPVLPQSTQGVFGVRVQTMHVWPLTALCATPLIFAVRSHLRRHRLRRPTWVATRLGRCRLLGNRLIRGKFATTDWGARC